MDLWNAQSEKDIFDMLGVSSSGAVANSPFASAKIVYAFAGLAPGIEGQAVGERVEDDRYFVGRMVTGAAWYAAAVPNVASIGTPLARFSDPSPPAAVGNTLASMYLVGAKFVNHGREETSLSGALPLIAGTGEHPLVLDQPIVIAPKGNHLFKINNQSAATISGQIVLLGRYIRAR